MQSAKSFFPDFNQIWIFATDFHRRPEYQVSREVHQMGAGLTYTDRLKNMTKLAVTFWDYANLLQPILTLNSSNAACANVTSFGTIV
jgi:hypothetical protein